jgi:hypothetical protein
VPPDFEARVENYFRRLSEDTGDDEDSPEEFDPPQIPQSDPPQIPQRFGEQQGAVPRRTLRLPPDAGLPATPTVPRRVPPSSGQDPFSPGPLPFQ